jgi:Protein of unknown function (DUF2889)
MKDEAQPQWGGPAVSTPARRYLSVRRTTTHDSMRPDGLLGPVVVTGRGRDLFTGIGDAIEVVGTGRLDAVVEPLPTRAISRIALEPPHEGVEDLVGVPASAGFRQAVDDAMPGERTSGSVRFQLLDDLPTALLVSGYALMAGGARVTKRGPVLQFPDMCAGWVSGGTLLTGMNAEGVPRQHGGPEAPSLERDGDALGWHEVDPLPPHGMRRRRRIDVWEEEGQGWVEGFFRDSHMDAAGTETIVHEYTVRASVDLSTMQFASCSADVGALPYPECPNAAASAGRLVGAPAVGLRRWVRDTFVGTSTCTHLNDTLRALEDTEALFGALRQRVGAQPA